MPLKLVLDTNTLVSAFFWEGNEAELLRKIEDGEANLYVTVEILNEVEDVIKRPKFNAVMKLANKTPDEIIQKLVSLSLLVVASKLNVRLCRDDKDNKFLECAIRANADYIISGDKDLLSMKKYKEVQIVKTSKILQLLNKPRTS